jgi:hypothetical protein
MSALVTDQFRILNASSFVNSVEDSSNSYYVFVGLSNPTAVGFGRTSTWDTIPPNPTDNFDYLNHNESTILFGKKITSANVRRVVKKIDWVFGKKYEMYRPDYSVITPSPIKGATRLYDAEYYVVNSDYRVYICIDNGSSGINTTGNSSQVEPKFTDLEPAKFSDGYVWKYLYTISPSDIIKFDSTEYVTIPNNWDSSTDPQIVAVRENGNSLINENQIKKVYVQNKGSGYSLQSGQSCKIVGDGSGGTVSVEIDSTNQSISNVVVTSGGSGYTYALIDLGTGSLPATPAELIPIIPPSNGHGFDIYKELGADKILIYARFDDSSKDFPVDTKFSQVGILKNPLIYDSSGISTTVYTQNDFSSVHGMMFSGNPDSSGLSIGSIITQTTSSGKKALGYVVSYDKETKVLKYYRDRSLYFKDGNSYQDFTGITTFFNSSGKVVEFESGGTVTSGSFSATISSFSGITTTVGNKIVNLGVQFNNGLSVPEINNKSGEIIYIDNRPTVTRNSRQKEDVKIILEF